MSFDPKDVKIEVIGVESLKPGDFLLVSFDPKQVGPGSVQAWADVFFKGSKARVGVIPDVIKVQVVGPREADALEASGKVRFREFL